MTPDKVEAALGAELCVLNHCTEPCEFHRRWARRLASVLTEALAERGRVVAYAQLSERTGKWVCIAQDIDSIEPFPETIIRPLVFRTAAMKETP